ncbi:MAG: hypothetical protein WDN72_03130 [Alphaproteobacteria bacterium]
MRKNFYLFLLISVFFSPAPMAYAENLSPPPVPETSANAPSHSIVTITPSKEPIDCDARIARMMGLVNTVVIAEYTGEYKQYRIQPSEPGGIIRDHFFKPVQFLKGAPVDLVNVAGGAQWAFNEPVFKKGATYLLLLERVDSQSNSEVNPRTWYNLYQPSFAILLKE